jgi:hypothetical protein
VSTKLSWQVAADRHEREDIVTRLRWIDGRVFRRDGANKTELEAADEIERLRSEVASLQRRLARVQAFINSLEAR